MHEAAYIHIKSIHRHLARAIEEEEQQHWWSIELKKHVEPKERG